MLKINWNSKIYSARIKRLGGRSTVPCLMSAAKTTVLAGHFVGTETPYPRVNSRTHGCMASRQLNGWAFYVYNYVILFTGIHIKFYSDIEYRIVSFGIKGLWNWSIIVIDAQHRDDTLKRSDSKSSRETSRLLMWPLQWSIDGRRKWREIRRTSPANHPLLWPKES